MFLPLLARCLCFALQPAAEAHRADYWTLIMTILSTTKFHV